jgi:hypothetical protein
MPIDPNIILQAGANRPQLNDPLEQYGKSLALKGLLGQQDLQALQTQAARKNIADDELNSQALRESGGDQNKYGERLMALGLGKQYFANKKDILANKLTNSTIDKNTAEVPKIQGEVLDKALEREHNNWSNVTDPAQAAQLVTASYQNPITGPHRASIMPLQQALQNIPQDPAALTQYVQKQQMGVKDYAIANKPTIHTTNNGQTQTTQAYPGLGGAPTTLSSTPMQVTPDARLSANTQLRGQNMVDARARDANNGSEAQFTPEAITNAAARYNIDGTLPPMGMGKTGAQGRSAILNKAAELAATAGVTPDQQRRDQLETKVNIAGEKNYLYKNGPQVRGFNVLLNHLDTAQHLYDALNNGDVQAINRAKNAFKTQFGQEAPTDLAAARQFIAGEAIKGVTGAAGALGDREEAQKNLAADKSPTQFNGAINTIKELSLGQLEGHEQQYKSVTGDKGDFQTRFLTDKARALYQAKQGGAPAAAPTSAPIKIQGDDGYNALPKGAHYVGPDGVPRIK